MYSLSGTCFKYHIDDLKYFLCPAATQKHRTGNDDVLHTCPSLLQAQLLEAKKRLETQNTLQQKTRELLRTSEQQVVALKAQLSSASSDVITPAARAAGVRAPPRGKRLTLLMIHKDATIIKKSHEVLC